MNSQLHDAIAQAEPSMLALLKQCIGYQSVSGQEAAFVQFVAGWAKQQGFIVDLWQSDEGELAKFAASGLKHIPLAGRPTLVVKLRGRGQGQSLIFNAHSDVVAVPNSQAWWSQPWGGDEVDGRVYGRGACDVKGPLVSALWSMVALKAAYPAGLDADVLLELIPGEEDCVTLGTATSIARGYTADLCVVLEPTESLPRNASRGGCRFEIECRGRAVHGTVKWLGEDAIEVARLVLGLLPMLEKQWNDRCADGRFTNYPIARPITVDMVHGGQWQGMLCDSCRIGGYLELLPDDEPQAWKQRFIHELARGLSRLGIKDRCIEVRFPEEYRGHALAEVHPGCRVAQEVVEESKQFLQNDGLRWAGWAGFNSGCEAGLRSAEFGTPTLVWGPGSLAQAHAVDEFVEFGQVRAVAGFFARFAERWTGGSDRAIDGI